MLLSHEFDHWLGFVNKVQKVNHLIIISWDSWNFNLWLKDPNILEYDLVYANTRCFFT